MIFLHFVTHFVSYLGEKKLGKVITPDPWKAGARNTTGNLKLTFLKNIYSVIVISN